MDGDELIPDAGVVLDRHAEFACSAETLWPWTVQLGKDRAGWYLPGWLERLVPRLRRALAIIEPRLQDPRPGDVVPDWGPGDPTFTVVSVDPPRAMVYRSVRPRRRGWSSPGLWSLEPLGPSRSRLRLRLRTRSLGRRFPRLVTLGADLFAGRPSG